MRVMFPFQEGEGKFSRFPDIIYYIYDIKDHYMYSSVWFSRRDGDSGSESDVSPMRGRRPKSSVEPWYENQWNEAMQG